VGAALRAAAERERAQKERASAEHGRSTSENKGAHRRSGLRTFQRRGCAQALQQRQQACGGHLHQAAAALGAAAEAGHRQGHERRAQARLRAERGGGSRGTIDAAFVSLCPREPLEPSRC